MQVRVALNTQFLNSPKVDRAGTTVGTIHHIPFFKEKFGKVCAILTGDTSYYCSSIFHLIVRFLLQHLKCTKDGLSASTGRKCGKFRPLHATAFKARAQYTPLQCDVATPTSHTIAS